MWLEIAPVRGQRRASWRFRPLPRKVAPEVGEFFALVGAAQAAGVRVVAHHASFDVARLNHTAHRHSLRGVPSLCSAGMLCTMHGATKHCRLRTRGTQRLKALIELGELDGGCFDRPRILNVAARKLRLELGAACAQSRAVVVMVGGGSSPLVVCFPTSKETTGDEENRNQNEEKRFEVKTATSPSSVEQHKWTH